jgi:hypothetical protein
VRRHLAGQHAIMKVGPSGDRAGTVLQFNMGEGRLIRVSRFRGDPEAVSYLVAIPNKGDALDLIANQAAMPGYDVEDLGRVSEALITTMRLAAGQFMPVKGVRDVSQLDPAPKDE